MPAPLQRLRLLLPNGRSGFLPLLLRSLAAPQVMRTPDGEDSSPQAHTGDPPTFAFEGPPAPLVCAVTEDKNEVASGLARPEFGEVDRAHLDLQLHHFPKG